MVSLEGGEGTARRSASRKCGRGSAGGPGALVGLRVGASSRAGREAVQEAAEALVLLLEGWENRGPALPAAPHPRGR